MTSNSSLASAVEFADNAEQRCACVLLLDTSDSMRGERIERLNDGLVTLREELLKDPVARLRVELAILTFDSDVTCVRDFAPVDSFEPPKLTAQYQTFMGHAVLEGLGKLEERKVQYKSAGVPYYRPLLFLMTDGRPEGEATEVTQEARDRLRIAQENNHVTAFGVGVGSHADLAELERFTGREPLLLRDTNFQQLFQWLSSSLSAITKDRADVPLFDRWTPHGKG